MTCIPVAELVETRIDRVLTQYRESPNLLFMLRTYLGKVAEIHEAVCALPDFFDIETAVGDQLTLLGKRLGWGRCHCVCDTEPVFGFYCADEFNINPIVGFCEPSSTWDDCGPGVSDICINDDETYRAFLKVRIFQFLGRYDLASLEQSIRLFFGPQAMVLYRSEGKVVIAPGRDLTTTEILFLQLYPRVLPIALGIQVLFHFGTVRVFGFGDGWGGFDEFDLLQTQATPGYQATEQIFGFCDDQGGFCEDVIGSDPLETLDASWMCKSDSPWMCQINVQPYDC